MTDPSYGCNQTRPGRFPQFIWLALVISAAAWLLWNGRLDTDITRFLPQSPRPLDRLILQQLREGPASRLVLIAIEGAPSTDLAELSDALANTLRTSPYFSVVLNGPARVGERERELLTHYRYLLSPGVTRESFTKTGLQRALEERLHGLFSSFNIVEKRLLFVDPTGELLRLFNIIAWENGPVRREGVWFSNDGKKALLMAQTALPAYSVGAQEKGIRFIRHTFERLTKGRVLARITMTGPPFFAVQIRGVIQQEAWTFSLLAFAGAVSFLLWFFRSWRVLYLVMIALGSGILAGASVVNIVFGSIHGIALSFGATLIGVAVDYPIHWFTYSARYGSRDTILHIWPTIRLGLLTSCLGYLPMLASNSLGLAQLGLFAIVGLAAAAAVTRWVLPGLDTRISSASISAKSMDIADRLTVAFRYLHWLPILVLAAGLFFIGLRDRPLWENDLDRLSPIPVELKQQDRALRQALGAPELRNLVVIFADSQSEALQKSETLLPALNEWMRKGRIKGFDLAARLLPSQAVQRARQEMLPESRTLRRNLRAALASLPIVLKEELFTRFIEAVQTSRSLPPLTLADLKGTVLEWWVKPRLFESGKHWVALITLRDIEEGKELSLLNGGGDKPDRADVHLIDLKKSSESLVARYASDIFFWLAIGAALIWIALWCGLRNWRNVVRVTLPVAAAVVATMTVVCIMQGGLSIFHIVSLLLVAGLGMDYALFFQRHFNHREERTLTTKAILACGFTTLLVFLAMSFSQTLILSNIGRTITIGVLFSMLFGAASVKPNAISPEINFPRHKIVPESQGNPP